ncbi:hypothetical protein JOE65_000103 [Arthrobacter roseus]|nr:hypothetical protein [Arthrobacter roseus]
MWKHHGRNSANPGRPVTYDKLVPTTNWPLTYRTVAVLHAVIIWSTALGGTPQHQHTYTWQVQATTTIRKTLASDISLIHKPPEWGRRLLARSAN